ncbi:MAG: potassium-transporting ATPase subunit F [Verrucomicrobia bacterium]|nr:potassium-transporting ATPase subunit F [Verrucomicrobiota bacterium]
MLKTRVVALTSNIFLALIASATMVYLIATIIWPEKF